MGPDPRNDLDTVIATMFDAAGFIFREGEWDMERAVKLMVPVLQSYLAKCERDARRDELQLHLLEVWGKTAADCSENLRTRIHQLKEEDG